MLQSPDRIKQFWAQCPENVRTELGSIRQKRHRAYLKIHCSEQNQFHSVVFHETNLVEIYFCSKHTLPYNSLINILKKKFHN